MKSRYDVGDRVWHKDEKLECYVIEVSDCGPTPSYALRQSRMQEEVWGKINWCAWLYDKDLGDVR